MSVAVYPGAEGVDELGAGGLVEAFASGVVVESLVVELEAGGLAAALGSEVVGLVAVAESVAVTVSEVAVESEAVVE